MFFLLSKLLAFTLKPLTWLGGLAIYALCTKIPKRRRRALIALLTLFILVTNPWLVSQCSKAWETGRVHPQDIHEPYAVGILLGGYIDFEANTPDSILAVSRGNRLLTALALYKTGKVNRLLLSGGSGRLIGRAEASEAEVAADYLRQVGVPDSAIWVENRSRNTEENARYSRILLDSLQPTANCLLITSAWHLRRAEATFWKAGVHCQPFGTDYFSEKTNGNLLRWLEPDWEAIMKWECLGKEWVGWWVYWGKGYL
ncbi:MAG: YdcF family protein [Saprospiraceae bacterium]